MKENPIDQIIEEKLEQLREKKYKLRVFEMEVLLRIDSEYGVEETLQAIRAIAGVTVVSAMDSLFRKDSRSYMSHIKIKFHPKLDSTTAKAFVNDRLLPALKSQSIPGCKYIRTARHPEQIS